MSPEQRVKQQIAECRQKIDLIDEQIIELVRLRTEIADKVARMKRKNSIPLIDGKREMVIFRRYAEALGSLGRTMASAILSRRKSDKDQGDSRDQGA